MVKKNLGYKMALFSKSAKHAQVMLIYKNSKIL